MLRYELIRLCLTKSDENFVSIHVTKDENHLKFRYTSNNGKIKPITSLCELIVPENFIRKKRGWLIHFSKNAKRTTDV